MKPAALIFHSVILNLLFAHSAAARPVVVSFTSSPAEAQGLVLGYGLYYQQTNAADPYSWNYVSCCGAGNTNFYTDTTLIRGNPVRLCGDTIGRNYKESPYGPAILFDTNTWLAAAAKAEAESPTAALKVSRINSVQSGSLTHKAISLGATPADAGAGASAVTDQAIPGPAPRVSGIMALPDGRIQVTGIGASNQIYTVTASASLGAPEWIPIGPAFADGTNIQFFDQAATNYPQRFYRLSLP
jgi:hypothetical protein